MKDSTKQQYQSPLLKPTNSIFIPSPMNFCLCCLGLLQYRHAARTRSFVHYRTCDERRTWLYHLNIVVCCYYFCCGCSIGISARLQFALWIKRLQIGTKNKQTQTNYTHHPWVQQWWAYINSRTMALFERWHDEWYVCSTTWRTMVDCCI